MILRKYKVSLVLIASMLLPFFASAQNKAQLQRISYTSEADQSNRQFLLYLPKGYGEDPEKTWPTILFLHGNGERGNGSSELDFVMVHGPIYEAWIQKRDLPFIIIAPQLHMFGMDKYADYIANRTLDQLPVQMTDGVPKRERKWGSEMAMSGSLEDTNYPYENFGPPMGWEQVEKDLLEILDHVNTNYQTDVPRSYLTGLSYGGFGTWYLASRNPEKFAAISPVVGWGHVDLMKPLAESSMPIWCFAGGRDQVIEVKYFYPGLNELEKLGHRVRFTIESDMGHDTWKRVYAGDDIYNWFLSHSR